MGKAGSQELDVFGFDGVVDEKGQLAVLDGVGGNEDGCGAVVELVETQDATEVRNGLLLDGDGVDGFSSLEPPLSGRGMMRLDAEISLEAVGDGSHGHLVVIDAVGGQATNRFGVKSVWAGIGRLFCPVALTGGTEVEADVGDNQGGGL